jgi:hypothetical protein
MSKFLGKYNNSEFAKTIAMGRNFTDQQVEVPGNNVIFHRFVVIDVIPDAEMFFNGNDEAYEKKKAYWASINVSNLELARVLPRNTIIGKRIYDINATSVENPMFLFPFLSSHIALPCKPGEHVWVMFETFQDQEIGYWVSKITEIKHVDDVNHTHPPRAYEQSFFPATKDIANERDKAVYEYRVGQARKTDQGTKTSIDTSVVDSDDEFFYENLLKNSDASKLMTYEPVPRFKKRPGDIAIEGSNNTLIVLGTDRLGPIGTTTETDDGRGKVPQKTTNDFAESAGSIDMVAGRGQTERTLGKVVDSKLIDGSNFKKEIGKSEREVVKDEGDPDWINDKSRLLISQRTKVDGNLQISDINKQFSVSDDPNGDAVVLMKSDKIRVIGRKDAQILVKDDAGSVVTTVMAKSTGHVTIKAKNSSITIDSGGNVTINSAGNTTINSGANVEINSNEFLTVTSQKTGRLASVTDFIIDSDGPIIIGDDSPFPCAREGDPIYLSDDVIKFMSIIYANMVALSQAGQPVSLAGLTVPMIPPHGFIQRGSLKVKVS